jgi:hypothetical protein
MQPGEAEEDAMIALGVGRGGQQLTKGNLGRGIITGCGLGLRNSQQALLILIRGWYGLTSVGRAWPGWRCRRCGLRP